jgi:predicted acyltransferase (DUF342 family)
MPILVNRDVVKGDVLQSVVNTEGRWEVIGVSADTVFLRDEMSDSGYILEYRQSYLRTFMENE